MCTEVIYYEGIVLGRMQLGMAPSSKVKSRNGQIAAVLVGFVGITFGFTIYKMRQSVQTQDFPDDVPAKAAGK